MRYLSNPFSRVTAFYNLHRRLVIGIMLLPLCLALLVCWRVGKSHRSGESGYRYVSVPITEEEYARNFPYLHISETDRSTACDTFEALDISDTVDGIAITEGGNYYLMGDMTGRITIDAEDQIVHLFLEGVEITSRSGPAILCNNAGKLVITLVDGSRNRISDAGDYRQDIDTEACIWAGCDLTLNGTGTLEVNGYYKDAIRSKDILRILDGDYTVKCKRTGFHGNDGIVVTGGNFTVSSEKNGFKTANIGSDGRGSMIIGGGKMKIIAGRYAFVASRASLYVYNCDIQSRSVIGTCDVANTQKIQRGCIHEY